MHARVRTTAVIGVLALLASACTSPDGGGTTTAGAPSTTAPALEATIDDQSAAADVISDENRVLEVGDGALNDDAATDDPAEAGTDETETETDESSTTSADGTDAQASTDSTDGTTQGTTSTAAGTGQGSATTKRLGGSTSPTTLGKSPTVGGPATTAAGRQTTSTTSGSASTVRGTATTGGTPTSGSNTTTGGTPTSGSNTTTGGTPSTGSPTTVSGPTTTTRQTTTTTRQTTTTTRATTTTVRPTGDPLSCGSSSAAFCEDFASGASAGGRNGDLASSRFSVSRWRSEGPVNGPNYVGRANVGGCRSGLQTALPPYDALVCGSSGSIASGHALIATAQQNYGDTLARINQPFDISGRTGTFSFDMSLPTYGLLDGFPLVVFTQDPMSAPSYLADNSGGPTPRNGIAVHFKARCGSGVGATVIEFDNHNERTVSDTSGCPAQPRAVSGQLNRIQMRISQNRVELWASQPSSDGINFGELQLMYSGSISLPFSRGYLYFGVHNHASEKYSNVASVSARWDNLVFDGPRIGTTRVAQVADATTSGGGGVDLSYSLSESGTGQLRLPSVVPQSNARLAFNTFIDTVSNKSFSSFQVQYRLNGGTWRTATLSSAEIAQVQRGRSGSFSWSVSVPTGDLRSGANTIEFRGSGFSGGVGARIGNIDLITW